MHGRSGSGKSALLDRFVSGLEERGDALVLAGRCYEHAAVPFKALDGLVDSLARYLRGLPEVTLRPLLPRDTPLLARVFTVLEIAEPSVDAAVEIVRGIASRFEAHHGVRISEGAVISSVSLVNAISSSLSSRALMICRTPSAAPEAAVSGTDSTERVWY